ncbi:hypothetical protein L0337_44685 [candidate division KSB1 bacterium]|nr:hypothetical protein [candidate division KSB1 bacterium]
MLPVALVVAVTSAMARDDLFVGSSLGQRPFYVNVLYFRASDETKTLVEVFVEVPYSSLRFMRADTGYEARVEVAVIFDDDSGFQVDGHSLAEAIRADNFEATLSSSQARAFCFRFTLDPGPYALRVAVHDERANRRFSTTCKIDAPSFCVPHLKISSIQLAYGAKKFDKDFMLQKNGRIMIPNVQQSFRQNSPSGLVYFEAYNLKLGSSEADSFRVDYSIRRGRKEVYSARENYLKPGSMATVSVPLNMGIFAPGEYMLTVTVVDQNGKRKDSASAQFCIIRSANESKNKLALKSI